MTDYIYASIYNDNIQCTSTNLPSNIYTNKTSGNILIGSNIVNVNISNVSTNNLSVINNLNVYNVSVINNTNTNNLVLTNDIIYNTNDLKLYFNTVNNEITRTSNDSSTIANSTPKTTTPTASNFLIDSFVIPTEIIKVLSNKVITLNLYNSVNPDILGSFQYKFTIQESTSTVYNNTNSSQDSDDINDIKEPTDTPTLYQTTLYSGTFDETKTYIMCIYANSTGTSKNLYTYFKFKSFIQVTNYYKIGFTNAITNNYLFSSTTTGNLQNTRTINNTTETDFGIPMIFTKGIWIIEMFFTVNFTATLSTLFFTLNYKSIKNATIYNSTNYDYHSRPNGGYLINESCTIIVTDQYDVIKPTIQLVSVSTSLTTIDFKNVNTDIMPATVLYNYPVYPSLYTIEDANYSNIVSGFKYMRIG